MTLPPRSEWEQRTAATFNAIAEVVSEQETPLVPNDLIFDVRALMGEKPHTLDLGCGAGRLIPVLKGFGVGRIVGIDFSQELIRIAKVRYPEHDFRVGNILTLKDVLGEEKFDAFWAVTSLMHILPENMPQAISSIREVVREGAIGFITTPYGDHEDFLDARSLDTDGGTIPEGHYMFRSLWKPDDLVTEFTLGGFQMVVPSFHDAYMINLTVKAV